MCVDGGWIAKRTTNDEYMVDEKVFISYGAESIKCSGLARRTMMNVI